MKLNIPNFCFVKTQSKKNLKTFPYLDLRSPQLSIVVEYGPRSGALTLFGITSPGQATQLIQWLVISSNMQAFPIHKFTVVISSSVGHIFTTAISLNGLIYLDVNVNIP